MGCEVKIKKILLATIFVISIMFVGASCYNSSNTSSTSTAPVSTNRVTISNFAFSPQTITVSKDTAVTWTNQDSASHTVVSDDNKFNSSQLASGAKFKFTFDNAGTFSYHCSIHPGMTGKVIVQ